MICGLSSWAKCGQMVSMKLFKCRFCMPEHKVFGFHLPQRYCQSKNSIITINRCNMTAACARVADVAGASRSVLIP